MCESLQLLQNISLLGPWMNSYVTCLLFTLSLRMIVKLFSLLLLNSHFISDLSGFFSFSGSGGSTIQYCAWTKRNANSSCRPGSPGWFTAISNMHVLDRMDFTMLWNTHRFMWYSVWLGNQFWWIFKFQGPISMKDS